MIPTEKSWDSRGKVGDDHEKALCWPLLRHSRGIREEMCHVLLPSPFIGL